MTRRSRLQTGGLALLAAVLLLLSVGAALGQGTTETLTLDEYAARLAAAEAAIRGAAPASAARAVQHAAEDLGWIRSVTLPNGGSVPITPLFGQHETPDTALRRLAAVREQLRLAQEDRAAERLAGLDRVLASDALNPERGLIGWIRRLLRRDLSSDADPFAGVEIGRGVQIVLTVVGGLVAIVVLGLILQAVLGNFVAQADLRARQAGAGEALTADVARRRAADLARAGSYRDAVRQLYLSTLLSLEDRGLLRADRSLTNREVLAQLGAAVSRPQGSGAQPEGVPALQATLRPVIDVFESVWYGLREPDADSFTAYSRSVDEAVGAIGSVERGPANAEAAGEAGDGP